MSVCEQGSWEGAQLGQDVVRDIQTMLDWRGKSIGLRHSNVTLGRGCGLLSYLALSLLPLPPLIFLPATTRMTSAATDMTRRVLIKTAGTETAMTRRGCTKTAMMSR